MGPNTLDYCLNPERTGAQALGPLIKAMIGGD